jgi:CDGSH-type Zn-finger protein
LLALVSCDHQVLVEANAEMATADGDPAIICRCGASTALSGEWECDAR